MNKVEMLFVVFAGGRSDWHTGDQVRVISEGDTEGQTGAVVRQDYSEFSRSTAVLLDDDTDGLPAWFADYELEAV